MTEVKIDLILSLENTDIYYVDIHTQINIYCRKYIIRAMITRI